MAKRRRKARKKDPTAPPMDPRPFLRIDDVHDDRDSWHVEIFFRRVLLPLELELKGLENVRKEFGPTNSYPYPDRMPLLQLDREIERRRLALPAAHRRYQELQKLVGKDIPASHWINRITVLKTEKVGEQWLKPAKGEVIAQPAPPPPKEKPEGKRTYNRPVLRPVVCAKFV